MRFKKEKTFSTGYAHLAFNGFKGSADSNEAVKNRREE